MAQTSPQSASNDMTDSGVTVRSMRLKVLYSFDINNNTNCLARWPYVLQVQTVVMEEGVSIGVTDLKTCIQAITQCSPELVANPTQDYTVYAYDYSEYGSPQVGQGLLSAALAAATSPSNAPIQHSQQLITGRVCKNIQGLFSNGFAETLEVNLRLVPIQTTLQSERLANVERFRELSWPPPMVAGVNEWQALIDSNPNLAQLAKTGTVPGRSLAATRDGVSLEVFNQLLSPQIPTPDSTDPFSIAILDDSVANPPVDLEQNVTKKVQKNTRPSSRVSVKRPRKSRAKAPQQSGNTSGYEEGTDGDDGIPPKKRAKITQADWNSKSGFGSASDSLRVAASTAGSLRAFRPIAMTQRGLGASSGSHLQEIPRAPTPIPRSLSRTAQTSNSGNHDPLRRDSFASQKSHSRPYQSPYQMGGEPFAHDLPQPSIESAMTSPEKYDSAADTPPHIGSSPPVLRTTTSMRSTPQAPSSPILPQMPRANSGFMSGDMNDLFGENDNYIQNMEDVENEILPDALDRVVPTDSASSLKPPITWHEVNPGPPELLPTRILPRTELNRSKSDLKNKTTANPPRARSSAGVARVATVDPATPSSSYRADQTYHVDSGIDLPSQLGKLSSCPESREEINPDAYQPANRDQRDIGKDSAQLSTDMSSRTVPQPATRGLARTASVGSLTLPTITASDPVLPPSGLYRSQTWSEAPCPATDVPWPATDAPTPRERARGSTAGTIAKKIAQKSRLETALEKGEMPPFCSNCGAIETPTWRKAFAQEHHGDPGYHEYSDAPGRITVIEILVRDDEGRPTSYRMFKKSLLPDEDKGTFTELLFCNPCGIWMSKFKVMRPQDKWSQDYLPAPAERKPAERRPSVKGRRDQSKTKRAQSAGEGWIEPSPDAHFKSDVFGNAVHIAPRETSEAAHSQGSPGEMQDISQLSVSRHRASSTRPASQRHQMRSETASIQMRRAIQSSPAKWVGTKQSPIELNDKDMGATRRLLFPSPRKDEAHSALCEVAANLHDSISGPRSPVAVCKANFTTALDKENFPSAGVFQDEDEAFMKMFEKEMNNRSRPTTPVQRTSPAGHFKTPTRPTSNHRPITRSVSKSAKRDQAPPPLHQSTPCASSKKLRVRRSPRNHSTVSESPFTATINRLMSDAHDNEILDSPSRHLDLGLDLSNLPDLSHSETHGFDTDAMNFQFSYDPNHDFFSTDVPMPSSPPRLYNLFEASRTANLNVGSDDHTWSDFPVDETTLRVMGTGEISIDANGHASFNSKATNVNIESQSSLSRSSS